MNILRMNAENTNYDLGDIGSSVKSLNKYRIKSGPIREQIGCMLETP